MPTDDQPTPAGDSVSSRRPNERDIGTLARRYGPFLAVAVVVVAAVAVFGRNGGEEGHDGGATEAVADREELIRSGPMTPERAELVGAEGVDFGPGCDEDLGRIKLPTVYAPPCVEPFEAGNGGSTSPGVDGDVVKVVAYLPAMGALAEGVASDAGADLDRDRRAQTIQDYVDLYNQVFELYGRRVEVDFYTGTGAMDDTAAAKADAIAIAEKEPFAVIGGPDQASTTFASELATREVICLEGCAVGLPNSFLADHAPYVWMSGGGESPEGAPVVAEAVAKLAGPGRAVMAGDPELREQERVYAMVHYDTPDGLHEASFEAARDGLAKYGIELEVDVEFFLDTARMQETARTTINKLEAAGVTTVIYAGDPLTPKSLTEEATAQEYFPEWIHADGYLVDTAQFARTYDPDQWRNGFGLGYRTPAVEGLDPSDQLYQWAYGTLPPSNIASILEPPLRMLFSGTHLAGPDLTPETFRDGILRMPPSGGGPTRPALAWGDRPWTGLDDPQADVSIVWWDPEAVGVDEGGTEGPGMYRYANGGQRHKPGAIPSTPEEAGLFDEESSVVAYDELPPEDRAPAYPPPGDER